MTTVVYSDGVVATDGYITQGSHVAESDGVKRQIVKGVWFFLSGTVENEGLVIDGYLNGKIEEDDVEAASNVSCIVWDRKKNILAEIGFMEDGALWRYEVKEDKDRVLSIGSGQYYAVGATDMGATAKEAVQVAANRDVYTGGKIRTYRVNR